MRHWLHALLLAFFATGAAVSTAWAQSCPTVLFNFGDRPQYEDWRAHATQPIPTDPGLTSVSTSNYSSSAGTDYLLVYPVNSQQALAWYNDYDNLNGTSTVTFNFNHPVSGFSVRISDIDAVINSSNNFIDRVIFQGTNSGTGVNVTLTRVASSGNTPTISGSGTTTASATGTGNVTDGTTGAVIASFASPIDKLTLTYRNVTTSTSIGPTQQYVGIEQFAWCRSAPVAYDVTTTAVASTAGQVAIDPFNAVADGPIAAYRVLSVPNASTQGTLYYNSSGTTYTALTAANIGSINLTAAQAATLRFNPVNAASGNVTFTYRGTDNAGLNSNSATYTIPVTNTVCSTATAQLSFSTRPADEDWTAHAAVAVPANSTATSVSTGSYTTPANAQASTLKVGTVNAAKMLQWYVDYGTTSANTSSVTFTFSRPVSNFSLRVYDIDVAEDSNNGFIDEVTFVGGIGGATVIPTVGPLNPNACSAAISGNVATGTTGVDETTTANGLDGTVVAYFASPITSLTLTYRNLSTVSVAPTQQQVGIDLLRFCRLPPVANNVTTAPIANTAGATAVPSLSSTVDGTLNYYTLSTLPLASQGTLYVGGALATVGQQLTAAQAAQLSFAPASGFTGPATFTYTVTDDVPLTSAAAATYTIPVTAPGGAGSPAPCASAGKDGNLGSASGILNTYYPGTQSVAANATTLTVGAARGSSTPLAANDLVLVIQMQGSDINYTNTSSYGSGLASGPTNGSILTSSFAAGQYEYVQVASVSGSTVTLTTPLTNSYLSAAASETAGQRSFQVVRVPQYKNLTLGGNVTPSPWNGSTGGIVVLDVAGQLNLAGNVINASGAGFRGGAGRQLTGTSSTAVSTLDYVSSTRYTVHAGKGEGIAGTPRYVYDGSYSTTAPLDTRTATTGFPTLLSGGLEDGYPGGDNARGAPGNAGGGGTDGQIDNNQQNSGGGGGANGGAGGRGGNTWSGNQPTGGEPGAAFPSVGSSRLVMGGGGGAGTTNNGSGTPSNAGISSSGGAGGGIVLVRTGSLLGSTGGSITANGLLPAGSPNIDGAGGGGAGGSILLTVNGSTASMANLTLTATGGDGGDNTAGSPHGPGGGGGGGVIFTNGSLSNTSSVAAGTNGTTTNSSAYGAAGGSTGLRNNSISRQVGNSVAGATCIVEVTASLTGPTTLLAGQPTSSYTATFTNEGVQAATGVAQKVALPAGAVLTNDQRTALNSRYGLTTNSYSTTGSGNSAVTTIDFGTTALLAYGASNSYSFVFTAPTDLSGSPTITATTSTTGNEALNIAPNQASLALTLTGTADVKATIAPGVVSGTYAPGSTASFTVTFGNNGAQSAANAVRSVQLPAGLSGVTIKDAQGNTISGASYDSNTGRVTYPSGYTQTTADNVSVISFTMPGNGVVSASASISSGTSDVNLTNNVSMASVTPTVVPDLSTTISGSATALGVPVAVAGSPYTLNVTTTNSGVQATSSALQTVELPQGLTGVYVSGGGYYNGTASAVTGSFVNGNFVPAAGGSITINPGVVAFPPTGTLPAGQTMAYTITFNAPTSAFTPKAVVATQTGETVTANNTAYLNGVANQAVAPATATATKANVFAILSVASVTLADGTLYNTPSTIPNIIPAGAKVSYTAGVGNGGTNVAASTASNVTRQLQLIPGLGVGTLTVGGQAGTASGTGAAAVVTYGTNGPSYNVTTGLLTFPTLTTLDADASSTTAVVVTMPSTVGADGRLIATMSVGSTTSDTVPSDNLKALTVRVLPTADVVASVVGPNSATAGQTVSYTVAFVNNGPDTATGVAETVQVPTGLSAVTVTNPDGTAVTGASYALATGIVTLPSVGTDQVGATQAYRISFAAPAQPFSVGANAVTTSIDTAPLNNAALVATTVAPAADVAVVIAGPATAVAGNLVTYAVTTGNNGSLTANSVVTKLQLPTSLSGANVSNGSYDSGTGIVTFATVGSLPVGNSLVNYVTFTMPAAPTNGTVNGQLLATATVTTTTTDLVAGNNSAALTTSLAPTTADAANLTTTISPTPTNPSTPAASLSYTFNFSNSGSVEVGNVLATGNLPAGLTASGLRIGSQAGTLNAGTGLLEFANGATYNPASGAVVFPLASTLAAGNNGSYVVSFPAPGSGTVAVSSAITSPMSESTIADNQASSSLTITPSYDARTGISGPLTALPGSLNTYLVSTANLGQSTAPSITQTVTLPKNLGVNDLLVNGQAGTVTGGAITYGTNGPTYTQSTGVLTFPAVTDVTAGLSGLVTNAITVAMPSSGTLSPVASVTSTGESNTGNNTATLTTSAANQPPVARNVVNALRSARANNAAVLPISPLNATDADGTIAATSGYTLVSLPTTAQGKLYYGSTPVEATAGQLITDPTLLSFQPAAGFVGNAFFTYTATDNLGAVSSPGLYTIAVAPDQAAVWTAATQKGGTNPYVLNDVITYTIDPNAAIYNSSGLVYNANGTAANKSSDLDLTNGVVSASLVPNAGPTGNQANTLPSGLSINPTTGQIYVSNPSALQRSNAPLTYNVNVTTIDAYGGTTTNLQSFTIGAFPLPVQLVVFTAQAVQNRDGLLKWSTASELDNDHFDVERSLDGQQYTKIGEVKGQGSKASATSYAFTDAGIGPKVTAGQPVYYRLRQVDFGGTSTYSPVRTVSFTSGGELLVTVYPNPASAATSLDLSGLPTTGSYQVLLLDATGRAVRQVTLSGGTVQPLPLSDVASGTYLLLLTGPAPDGTPARFVQRLTKE